MDEAMLRRLRIAQLSTSNNTDLKRESEETALRNERKKKINSNIYKYDSKPLEEWGTNEFISYFSDLYYKKTSIRYVRSLADMANMKRLIEIKQNNEMIKTQIDLYFENEAGLFNMFSVSNFTHTRNQVILDQRIIEGKYTFVNKDKQVKKDEELDDYDFEG